MHKKHRSLSMNELDQKTFTEKSLTEPSDVRLNETFCDGVVYPSTGGLSGPRNSLAKIRPQSQGISKVPGLVPVDISG